MYRSYQRMDDVIACPECEYYEGNCIKVNCQEPNVYLCNGCNNRYIIKRLTR